ncbi:hypothetical protein Pcinc_026918 [Petrolisthes cinctipes]|uniref:Uncharacterized protein n=1 Tax=Petrolisthes cinctipes TaxID=88211 RepID=A0AAE1F5Z7_PETCI|nr:hypothetical protein Pcinc_026918 [Petrolisthes cinctipes]
MRSNNSQRQLCTGCWQATSGPNNHHKRRQRDLHGTSNAVLSLQRSSHERYKPRLIPTTTRLLDLCQQPSTNGRSPEPSINRNNQQSFLRHYI